MPNPPLVAGDGTQPAAPTASPLGTHPPNSIETPRGTTSTQTDTTSSIGN